MNDCWEEMAKQIKTFKRKLKKFEIQTSIEETKTNSFIYEATHQFIKES